MNPGFLYLFSFTCLHDSIMHFLKHLPSHPDSSSVMHSLLYLTTLSFPLSTPNSSAVRSLFCGQKLTTKLKVMSDIADSDTCSDWPDSNKTGQTRLSLFYRFSLSNYCIFLSIFILLHIFKTPVGNLEDIQLPKLKLAGLLEIDQFWLIWAVHEFVPFCGDCSRQDEITYWYDICIYISWKYRCRMMWYSPSANKLSVISGMQW